MAIYNTYFSVLGLQDSLGVLPNLGVLPGLGRLDDLGEYAFSPASLFLNGEQGVWYDPSDLTPEKVSWRRNLLTYSQDFENAAWTKSNASILSNLALYSQEFDNTTSWAVFSASVTANTTAAPDGTTTADTLSCTSSTGRVYQNLTVTSGVQYTVSVYAKAGTVDTVYIEVAGFGGGGQVNYNLTSGTVTSGTNATITAVGSGWYRLTRTFTASASGTGADWRIGTLDGTSKTIFLWGAQFVPGSTAQTYTRSLATAAPIQFADPLGGTLADKLVENTATSTHRILTASTITVSSGATVTNSVFVKAAERTWVALSEGGTSNSQLFFNLASGTFGTVGSGVAQYSATNLGSGWYRIQYTCVLAGAVSQPFIGAASADNTPSYTGDGVSGIYVYGAQVEQASTASAYQRITDFSSDFLAAFPTHALYQESTGVTPVTALGQSVGLVLDKRLGALTNLGPELVTNGTFDSGTTGWSAVGAASIAAVNGRLQVTRTGAGSFPRASCTVSGLTAGRSYAIRANFWAYEAINAGVNVSGLFASDSVTNAPYAMRSISGVFVASGTTATVEVVFQASAGTVGSFIEADNISVREVPGNHALQATSAARPTLQARSNLLTRTEEFADAAWTTKVNPVYGVTDPNGGTAAVRVTSSATNQIVLRQTNFQIVSGGNYTNRIAIRRVSGTGTISFTTSNNVLIDITSQVSSAWQYVSVADFNVLASGANGYFILQLAASGDSVEVAFPSAVLTSDAARPYQRVTTATDYADVGLPRNLTFDGIDDSLATPGNVDFATWTVGSRRNLLVNPTQFDAVPPWSKNDLTVTANNATAPDGTLTADTLAETATTATHAIYANAGTFTGAYTASIYVKPNGRTWCYMEPTGLSATRTWFNLAGAGSVGTTGAGVTATITATGDGWYRLTTTFTYAAAAAWVTIGLATGNNNTSYLGDGTSGVFLWGAQLEVGSTATAFQDVGTDKVTLFSGVTKLSDAAAGTVAELSTDSSGSAGSFSLFSPSSGATGNYRWRSRGTASADAIFNFGLGPQTNVVTGIGAIGADTSTMRSNGAVVATDATDQGTGNYGSYPLYIGRRGAIAFPFNGRLFQLVIRGAATDSVTVGNAERWVGQLTGVAL